MAKWTEAQQAAIEARGSNLLLSAAAGSGKTAVLVERIIGLILKDHIDIDKFLIVTFTSAAAGEMRERILKALMACLEQGADSADEAFIRHQINRIGKAYIMTLHAFCNDVVRKNFFKVGLDPAFKIGETSELELLKKEAVDEILEEAYEGADEAFVFLTEAYGGNRSDQKLEKLILKTHGFIQSQPNPTAWLQTSSERLGLSLEALDESIWVKSLMAYIRIEFEGVIDLARRALELCELPDGPEPYRKALETDLDGLEAIEMALNDGYTPAVKAFQAMGFDRLASIRKNNLGNISEPLMDEVKDLRDKIKKKVAEFKGKYFVKSAEDIVAELNLLQDKIERLCQLVIAFDERYREKKTDRNMADFNDLEHLALEILEDESIQALYRERFQYIFLDEYQDSNSVQETLIQRICRPDNRFLVGDVKQSIYKFRLADPSLFLTKMKQFDKAEGALDRRIDLSMNFRTRGEILAVVNGLFDGIMSESMGEIEYDADQYLYNGMAFPASSPDQQAVTLQIVDTGDQEDLDEEIQYMKAADIEAQYVAKQIRDLMGTQLYDPKAGVWRKVQYKDIAVLLRATKNWAGAFHETLGAWDIPVLVDVGTSFFEALEVSICLSLMKLVDNRRRDLDWMTVLRSPMVGLSVDDLAAIRNHRPKGSYFDAIQSYAESEATEAADQLRRLLEQLERWELRSRFKPLDEWLWEVLNETGFYVYAGAMPSGAARQANLRQLVDRAAALSGTTNSGLFQFVRIIEKMEKTSTDLEAAKMAAEHDNAVRVMSIHKSKGLEFPIVFVAGLGKKFNLMDTTEDVMLHKDLGIAPKFVDWQGRHFRQTFPQLAMKKQMTNEVLSEEMRILYVALTRPVERLFLVGTASKWESSFKKWQLGVKPYNVFQARSYLDWIAMYVLDAEDYLGPEEADAFTSELIKKPFQQQSATGELLESRIVVHRYKVSDLMTEKKESQAIALDLESVIHEASQRRVTESIPFATETAKQMQSAFEWVYPHADGQLPSKISVSLLKQLGSQQDARSLYVPARLNKPRFTETASGRLSEGGASNEPNAKQPIKMDYAARGTAFHLLMEHLELSEAHDQVSIQTYVAQCVERGLLSEELAAQVPIQWFLDFMASPYVQLLKRATFIKREWPFIYRAAVGHDSTLVQGIVDLYFEVDGKRLLLDYKTDFTREGALTSEIISRHAKQLSLYAEALGAIEGKPVEGIYLYLADSGEWIDMTLHCMGTSQ